MGETKNEPNSRPSGSLTSAVLPPSLEPTASSSSSGSGSSSRDINELKEKAGKLRTQLFGKTLVHPSEQMTGIRIGIRGGGGIPIIVFAN